MHFWKKYPTLVLHPVILQGFCRGILYIHVDSLYVWYIWDEGKKKMGLGWWQAAFLMCNAWCFPHYPFLYFSERISLEGGEESDIFPPVLSWGSAVLNSLSPRMPSRAPLISLALMYKELDLLPFLCMGRSFISFISFIYLIYLVLLLHFLSSAFAFSPKTARGGVAATNPA